MAETSLPDMAPRAGRTYGGEAPERRIAKRRTQFIAAGRTLFGSIGYRKTTMRALCREADLTDRYFYESFASLEDLLEAVYRERILVMQTALFAALQAVEDGQDPDTLVTAGLEAFFAFAEDPLDARIVWLEVLGVSPRIDALYDQTLHQFDALLLGLVRGAFPDWIRDDAVAGVLARGIVGAVSGSAMNWLLGGYRLPRATLVAGTQLLFRGLMLQARAAREPIPGG